MTPEERTQWIIVAFLVALLVAALVIGSRCERQAGDATPPATSVSGLSWSGSVRQDASDG